MVRFKRNELPALTAAREEELRAMAGRPDSDIDYSDIPPLS
ncbi:toxin-antitoxin system, antitoxin component, partial [Salmonella enterica]